MTRSVRGSVRGEEGGRMGGAFNAVWLAYMWATNEGSVDAVSALTRLIVDWPMDFIFIIGATHDEMHENMFKWSVNMCARVERLRDFVGLETSSMMRIVSTAADIIKTKLVSGKKVNAAIVHKWLVENVHWGALHCPDALAVERHMPMPQFRRTHRFRQ